MQATINNSQTPLVSIIIPTYNRETLIAETLDSLINQTYTNWECIVVDDGSTDNTVKIIKEYAAKDSRFKFHTRKRTPKGAPTCRNIGLECSKGCFVLFLDSDDILLNYALEVRVSHLRKNKDVDFCVSNGIIGPYPIEENNTYYCISTSKSQDVLEEFFNFTPPWVCLNPTYRIEALRKHNLNWDPSLKGFQDIDFHTQILLKNLKFNLLNNKPDCLWRQHDKGNIGSDLRNNINGFQQKLIIFKKTIKNMTKGNAIKTFAIHILHNNPATTYRDLIEVFWAINKAQIIAPRVILLFLLRNQLIDKKIPIIPRLFTFFLKNSKNRDVLINKENLHFAKREYPINNIIQ